MDSSFEIRLGKTKKLAMMLYSDNYSAPIKKVSLSVSKKGIVSVGKVSYKKITNKDWYGNKIITYRATVKITPKKNGVTVLTAKTKSGKKVKWKITVKNAFTAQMAEGELGFIKWMLKKDGLTEAQKTDLNRAKRILEIASKERISDWLPDLKDGYGNTVKDGYTLDCSRETDAAYIANLHANYKAYKELIKMQGDDPYRKIYMKDAYGSVSSLRNGGKPYTNFTAVVGSMVDEDRFDVYHHHNPRWGEISVDYNADEAVESYDFASSEVWASPSDAAYSVDLWFSERTLVDDAVKDLGYKKSSMTVTQLDKAISKAGSKGVVGHYTFCLYADHKSTLGFASSSYGSLGHSLWADDARDSARYTFKKMDDYVTEYLKEIGY